MESAYTSNNRVVHSPAMDASTAELSPPASRRIGQPGARAVGTRESVPQVLWTRLVPPHTRKRDHSHAD